MALAGATDRAVDPDRRAWHRVKRPSVRTRTSPLSSKTRPREHSLRGGFAAAGVFLERSMALTLDPSLRALRALNAAQAKRLAGPWTRRPDWLPSLNVGLWRTCTVRSWTSCWVRLPSPATAATKCRPACSKLHPPGAGRCWTGS